MRSGRNELAAKNAKFTKRNRICRGDQPVALLGLRGLGRQSPIHSGLSLPLEVDKPLPGAAPPSPNRRPSLRALPTSIWALGFGSLFMDTSSELVHSLLPLYMAGELGREHGHDWICIEGIAEATAAITKVFSGVLSDYLGKRKFLVVLGYGLGVIDQTGISACDIDLVGVRRALRRPGGRGNPPAPRAMRWWRTLLHLRCVARPMDCASR